MPHSIEFNNRTITDPATMSNFFDNYFLFIAKKTNSYITQATYLLQTQIPFS